MSDKAWLLVITFFILAPRLQAEETYTIKIRKPHKGDSYWVGRIETTEGSARAVTAEGKELVNKNVINRANADSYRETVLAIEEGDEIARLYRASEKGQTRLRWNRGFCPVDQTQFEDSKNQPFSGPKLAHRCSMRSDTRGPRPIR